MINKLKHLLIALAGAGLLENPAAAQTFTTLHSFTGSVNDAGNPYAGLTLSGNTIYGAADGGTLFVVNTDGTGFTSVHNFTFSDGGGLDSGLILSGNILYGTASYGGSSGNGTVFKVSTNGTGFTILHNFTALYGATLFTNTDGAFPYAGLVLSGNTLYGTALNGGSSGNGTVFAVNTDGTGFTNLHSFTDLSNSTNRDGVRPLAGLVLSGNTLYGTAQQGGSANDGTVYAVNTDGTGFTNLYNFTGGSDGSIPSGALLLSGNTLYGTASSGGTGYGTVFKVNTNGTGFTTLHSFVISDGIDPIAGLILSGSTLYGTANAGGSGDGGTVFEVNTDGTGFTNLYNFAATSSAPPHTNSDGAFPDASLILSGKMLYGTAEGGGDFGRGTVFALSLSNAPVSSVLTNIAVFPANPLIGVSSNQQFTATGYYNDGSVQTLTSNLLWTSSSTAIASININGLATGLDSGNTAITAISGASSNSAALTVVAPPTITTQPANNMVSPNGGVSLSVSATGGTLSYQWQFNGTNIRGATGAMLTIPNVALTNAGVYSVIVSNLAGIVTSQAAIVGTTDIKMFAGIIVDGPLGSNYLIQAKSNLLSSWINQTNVALPTQPYIYIDYGSVTNKQQFYRAMPE